MINELREDISRLLKKYTRFPARRYQDIFILYILYLKHLCDINKYKYEEIINDKNIYDLFETITSLKKHIEELPINQLLRNISFCDTKELTCEFIDSFDELPKIYNDNEKRLFFKGDRISIFSNYIDLTGYDKKGLTTYIIKNDYNYETFKVLDEILEVKNNYLKEEDIKIDNYNCLLIYDTKPKYSVAKDINIYDLIHVYTCVHKIDSVILYTKYSKISNFKEGRNVLRYLKTVLLKEDYATLIFNKDAKEISIVNCDNMDSIEKIKQIIKNNKKKKDVLVKTSYKEIYDNNLRIGFSLYELDKSEEIKDINKIVDENTELLENLNRINSTVEQEINKLLNR